MTQTKQTSDFTAELREYSANYSNPLAGVLDRAADKIDVLENRAAILTEKNIGLVKHIEELDRIISELEKK